MGSDHDNTDPIEQERLRAAKAGNLHLVHWVVIALSLLLTWAAWRFSSRQVEEKIDSQFRRQADQVIALVLERMEKYEDALWGGVSAIQAQGGDVSDQGWAVFAEHLRIQTKYPGINGIGVIYYVSEDELGPYLAKHRRDRPGYRLHPKRQGTEYWPITYIEPVSANVAAVGLDMAHETNRYTAAKLARDSGTAQITGPITLVQDDQQTPGFLFYAPFYRGGVYDSPEDRRKNITGLVYAPFEVSKLLAGTLGKDQRHVGIRITDGDTTLYDEHLESEEDYDPESLLWETYPVPLYGREWLFDIRSAKSFRNSMSSSQPLIILLGGMSIDLLLFLLFLSLTRANRRAIVFADKMTEKLHERTAELERSNQELEQFAYVASHDLKTPLRGIGDLAEYLEDDLDGYLRSPTANPDVMKNLGRLNTQVTRMDSLIKGILAYSSVGGADAQMEEVNVTDLVHKIRADLRLGEGRCVVDGDLPTIFTDPTQLTQVLTNLIGNAFKYHHDPDNALVKVSAHKNDEVYELSVSDNGPGIDPRFHSRIFDVFQTLHSKDEIDSTGIGLSIVKKVVENHGGKVSVSSQLGQGATFTVSWPIVMSTA